MQVPEKSVGLPGLLLGGKVIANLATRPRIPRADQDPGGDIRFLAVSDGSGLTSDLVNQLDDQRPLGLFLQNRRGCVAVFGVDPCSRRLVLLVNVSCLP